MIKILHIASAVCWTVHQKYWTVIVLSMFMLNMLFFYSSKKEKLAIVWKLTVREH